MTNAVIGTTWIICIFIWHKSLVLATPYSNTYHPLWERVASTRVSLRQVFNYDLPSTSTIYLIIALMAIAALGKANEARKRFLYLFCTAFAMAIVLAWTGIYEFDSGRHMLWLLPLVICFGACIMADAYEWVSDKLIKIFPLPWQKILAVVTAIYFLVTYNPALRFADSSEYEITKADLSNYKNYLASLKSADLIIVQRDEALLFTNVYPAVGNTSFTGKTMAILVPYANTHMLFNPYFRWIRSTYAFLQTFHAALDAGMLNGIETLVFMRSGPVIDLIQCEDLKNKKVQWMEERAIQNPYVSGEIISVKVPLLIVPKNVLLTEVISPDGAAHHCLKPDSEETLRSQEPIPPQ